MISWQYLAQATQPANLPFFERLLTNDTIRNTTLVGWLVLFGGIFVGVTLGKIASTVLRAVAARVATHGWEMRSIVIRSFAGPSQLALIGLGISIGIGQLAPSPQLSASAARFLALLYIVTIGWIIYNCIDLVHAALQKITSRTESKLDDQIVPLVTKTIRVFEVVIITLFAAENVFGANIGAWLAGLGIAGLAVSLAAQDSIKQLFGSISILVDHPFTQGDFVKIAGQSGTVEDFGFRSTRLRTADGTLVTISNSEVANSAIENFQRRPAIRRIIDVTLTYDTPPEKLREAIAILQGILAEPEVAGSFDLQKMPPRVYLDNLNADSINIKVFFWVKSLDYWPYMELLQKVNLMILERLAAAGIELAFPTRTLYLASDPKHPFVLANEAVQAG